VKAFSSSDYATAAQGALAASAQQPPSEGAFANGDKTKLDAIASGANNYTLPAAITGMTDITFASGYSTSTLKGNDYPTKPTTATYLDLTSSTNIIPSPYLVTKIQRTQTMKSFGTSFSEFSSSFRTSFTPRSTSVIVSWSSGIFAYAKVCYAGLYDYDAGAWWGAPNETRQRFKYDNGTDQDYSTFNWVLTGLTPGTTYYISPYFSTNGGTMYIFAGNNGTSTTLYANCILSVIDSGDDVTIY